MTKEGIYIHKMYFKRVAFILAFFSKIFFQTVIFSYKYYQNWEGVVCALIACSPFLKYVSIWWSKGSKWAKWFWNSLLCLNKDAMRGQTCPLGEILQGSNLMDFKGDQTVINIIVDFCTVQVKSNDSAHL